MGKRVQVIEYYNYRYDGRDGVKARYEGEIVRFMTYLDSHGDFIYSHEMALIQLDDGRFMTAPIENIRLIK